MKSKILKAKDFKIGFASGLKFMGFWEDGRIIWRGLEKNFVKYGLNLLNRQKYETNR